MGVTRRDGRRYLSAEEAFYLVQSERAIAELDQKRLSLADLYRILEACNVSLLKLAAYSEIVRAGYVVKQPVGYGLI
jgi:hypothetical protein